MTRAQFSLVIHVIGILLVMLAVSMLVPALVDLKSGSQDWKVFVGSALMTGFVGAAAWLANRGKHPPLGRAGFLLTVLAWVAVTTFGALPFLLGSLKLGYADAFFEAMSGLTTTGATILTGLDAMPPGILIWRSLLQWVGGLGIVAMAIVLLPALGVGGMSLFRSESSDISERNLPRLRQAVGVTLGVHVSLTVLCFFCLMFAGMTPFDAVNHAMTVVSTGGFSTHDASIGYFQSPVVEAVMMVFMIAGALPLIFYAHLFIKGIRALVTERQVTAFLLVWLIAVVAMTGWNWHYSNWSFADALRLSTFHVTSLLTDSGYWTVDASTWGSFPTALLLVLLFVGGCAGSTAGSIKIFRWHILFRGASHQLNRTLTPHRVLTVRYGGRSVDADMLGSVRNFFFMYMGTVGFFTLGLTVTGIDPFSALTAVAGAMASAGPGLGSVVGPTATLHSLPDAAKWLLSAAMLVGRLELSTVYVLLLPHFWRR